MFRTAYSPPVRVPMDMTPDLPSRAIQSAKDECDVNLIVRKAQLSGFMPGNGKEPLYGDFTAIPDYQTALETVIAAQEAFDALPATVRDRFFNDPGVLLNFVNDPKNEAEAIKLGLLPDPKGAGPSAPHEAGEAPAPVPPKEAE